MIEMGLKDESFIRGKVPMTKAEIRAMVMVKAKIQPTDVVVDIGAGTGSISIEAARQAYEGYVYAVERNAEGIALIEQNAAQFGISHIQTIHGVAPDCLGEIARADVIIIGGSGGQMGTILDECARILEKKGRIVLTAVTVESAYEIVNELQAHHMVYEGFQMQVNRLRQAGRYHLFQPISPIFVMTAAYQEEEL